jgi:hypothetical protein
MTRTAHDSPLVKDAIDDGAAAATHTLNKIKEGSVVRRRTAWLPHGTVTNMIGRKAACVQWPDGGCTKEAVTGDSAVVCVVA